MVLLEQRYVLFRADHYIEELKNFATVFIACSLAMESAVYGSRFHSVDEDSFALCPDESIDYTVMEKTNIDAICRTFKILGWSDVGSLVFLFSGDK